MDIEIIEKPKVQKIAENKKQTYKTKLMIESLNNPYILFSSSANGFGPQIVNRMKTGMEILKIIKERSKNE